MLEWQSVDLVGVEDYLWAGETLGQRVESRMFRVFAPPSPPLGYRNDTKSTKKQGANNSKEQTKIAWATTDEAHKDGNMEIFSEEFTEFKLVLFLCLKKIPK